MIRPFPGWEGWESAVCIRRTSLWSVCHPQRPFPTKALLPSLFKGFLKCGSSPPRLSRALCRCHTLHRALALQDRLSCCPLVPFPRHGWGSCDTPHISKGRASACSPLLNAFPNTSFKSMLIFSFANHALCPSLQTSSFILTTAKVTCNFCLLFIITICHLSVLGINVLGC